ncbi:hypothetical protein [Streptomyces sp. NPDC006997]|uniref:hypothetical protein n=1 Tax=Streptomyces sp. NPDC006997 TaxID=3155356 RepID=UPI003407F8AB
MSDSTTASSDLASQYAAQVTGDLERNLKEQERVSTEIAALQEQLLGLQQDHAVLVNMQQALGVTRTAAEPTSTDSTSTDSASADPAPTVPAPRRRKSAASGKDTSKDRSKGKERSTKASGPSKRRTKAAATPAEPTGQARQPTLIDLVRDHLARQTEPRSAAEVTAALGEAHPDRKLKTTVVRGTLETLVAKSQAQRGTQGRSVFYTATDGDPAPGDASAAAREETDTDR